MFAFSYYRDLQKKLFPDLKTLDYLKHYYDLSSSHNFRKLNKLRKIYNKPQIERGVLSEISIHLLPGPGVIKRNGELFYNELLNFFNNNYWLVSLWVAMYVKTQDSDIGREITRAFIKNCICETTEFLLIQNKKSLNSKDINKKNFPNSIEYYQKVFSVKKIFKNMRRSKRIKLINHYKLNRWHQDIVDLEYLGLNTKNALLDIFKRNNLEEFNKLVEISVSHEKGSTIKEPLEAMLFFIKAYKGKRKIRAEITNILDPG